MTGYLVVHKGYSIGPFTTRAAAEHYLRVIALHPGVINAA